VAEQAALSFGGLLRQLRVEARLTQEELAEAAGLSPRSVSDLERGVNRTAHKDTAGLLADALGLTEPVRALFVAAARGRSPAGDVLAAREGRTPGAAHDPASTPRPYFEQILAARGAIEGERKQVTVLLCDLVTSSDLVVELEPEEAQVVADRFLRFALDEVRKYEGTINQVRQDGFTALFGAPIGHEDHARRAVLAALGIAAGAEVRVKIGINSGLVVVGAISDELQVDCTPVGDTTVLAARLQAAAPPGAVLVSQRTAGLVRGYFRVEEVAPVKVEERTLYPVLVTGLDIPIAPVASADQLSPFAGRDREMAELRRTLEVVAGGEGQVVGLVSDPGLGKSRLAFEFRGLAERHAAVIEARCLSYGASIPYLPVFELVRDACGITADDSPALVASKMELRVTALGLDTSLAHYLRHAFGVIAGDPGLAALDPQAIRDRTFEALRRLLVAEARRRPLVVLVEDLHWIDHTSEDFLAGFVDELPSVPIMLLVTYRSGYIPRWIGKSYTSQLALRPLSLASSHEIVDSILAGADPGARAAITARGEGNPFFLEELASAVRGHAVDAALGTVPETIQQVLAARIDRLGADQKAAIQIAAVLGREFSLELATQVWDGTVPVEERLQELKGLEFFRERHGIAERTLVFKHALTREVAYDSMPQPRRRHLHGRAGAALEQSQASQRFEHWELLAYHYSHSADPARAIPSLVVAGDRARDRYANEEAIGAYSQAARLIEQTGSDPWPDTYGATCESLGSVLVRRSRYEEAIEAYRKGLAVARGAFQRTHLHVLCAKAETAAHRYPEALTQCDLAEKALGPAHARPEPEWLSPWFDIQDVRMEVLYWLNDTEAYARLIEQVRSFAEAHGSAEQRTGFFVNAIHLSLRRGRYVADDQTVEFARDAYKAAQEAGAEVLWRIQFEIGFALLWHGDLDEATAMLQDSLREAERRGEATIKSRATTYLMVVMRKRGDVSGVREAIPSVIERAREASLPEYEAMAIANRAWVAWRSGERETAAADAQAALEGWEKLPVRYPFDWMAAWPLIAMTLVSSRIAEAADYAGRMLPPPQQPLQEPVRTLVDGAVQAWENGQPAETEELLRRAVRAAADLGYL
jgi:class 3 adenylate cyclase/tetratricopeptide (TPR) repeat protein/DNA-binding XRE family transcriptional regulator